ncbi:MAG: transcriptional repressor, partial [Candidatus Krumholzibacteria bacterium]|nr:transcriptional repressor [Candidatus Krumholzibacteria bacterium]
LSFSTVYNTLNMLEKIGEIKSLNLFDEFLNYDPDTGTHFHLVCRECNAIVDIFPEDLDNVALPRGELAGHWIDGARVVFRGTCKDCR